MNIFLIWSGETSHAVARALREWIPSVLQRVHPFLSSEDIRKGARWQQEIAQRLADVKYAIVCLTADNLTAPWIHFEAGAVSKQLDVGKVSALLIGVEARSLQGPLTQFQNTPTSKEEVLKLVKAINDELGDEGLNDGLLAKSFSAFWPELEQKLTDAQAQHAAPAAQPVRPVPAVLDEVLELSRATGRSVAQLLALEERLLTSIDLLASRQQPSVDDVYRRGLFALGADSAARRSLLSPYMEKAASAKSAAVEFEHFIKQFEELKDKDKYKVKDENANRSPEKPAPEKPKPKK